ncbi:MAG: DUF1003 domain-containing protein [Gammaproteobacteria bacterium]|nr:DUF1003 domain-containing protein [Gammaproteobacteria bacterium]
MSTGSLSGLLAEVSLFARLDEQERDFLASRVRIVRFDAGSVMFRYGDPGNSMYVLKAGRVELSLKTKTGEHMVFAILGEHDFFGEISLLDGGARTASAHVLDDVEALEIDRSDLDELFRLQPSAALHLLTATGGRLRQTTQLLRNASTRNPNEDIEERRTLLVRLTDWIAQFAGSLVFLGIHVGYFAFWLGWNVFAPADYHFDQFPFGFLTLVVSLETIILSVFVLLSQNRQAERDRVRNDVEYDVNLKAEMQIAHMHEKIDENYAAQQKRLDAIERKLETMASKAEYSA